LTHSYLNTKSIPDGVAVGYGKADNRQSTVTYKGVKIGTITPVVNGNKTDGVENIVDLKADGFDLDRIEDESYLESLIKPVITPEPEQPVSAPVETPVANTPIDITEEQETKIQILNDLAEKMNNRFDTSLRTASHYFEWVGNGENRKLKLWHRLHDEIGSNFYHDPQDKKNWSNNIKELYAVVYHNGYSEEE